MIQGAILSPYWSRYTMCATKKDYTSIFSYLKKTLLITLFLFILILITSKMGFYIVDIWMGGVEYYSREVFLAMAILTALMNWSSIFSTLFNGIGVLKIQVYISIVAIFVNIPLSIILVKWYGFGVEGIIYGTIASLSIFGIIAPFIVRRKILKACLD